MGKDDISEDMTPRQKRQKLMMKRRGFISVLLPALTFLVKENGDVETWHEQA